MAEADPFHLQRFTEAQAAAWEQARSELRAGSKRSHWMWFVFPQIHGLGSSPMAVRYAIGSLKEAQAYLRHPLLGARLRELSEIVLALDGRSIEQIFGYPDDLKFHSSMTLFAQASGGDSVYGQALRKYFRGEPDQATLERLA